MARSKAYLKRGYLSRRGGGWRPISSIDLAVLLYHVLHAAEHPDVGWEDANHTFEQMIEQLRRTWLVDPKVLESALWACNLLDEQGEFKHLQGYTFENWVKSFCRKGERFNRTYNFFEHTKQKDRQADLENNVEHMPKEDADGSNEGKS